MAFLLLFFGLVVLLHVTLKYPEITFGLFLFAGIYKGDVRLKSFLPSFFDLTILFEILTIIGVLYNIFIRRRIRFIVPSIYLMGPLVVFISLAMLSLTYSQAPIYGRDKLLRFVFITTPAMFLPLYLFQNEKFLRRFFSFLLVFALAIFLDMVSKGLQPMEFRTHSAFGSNYIGAGRVLGAALIITFFYFMATTNKFLAKIICYGVAGILIFAFFVTGSRGPIIGFIISVMIYTIFLFFKSFRLRKEELRLFRTIMFSTILISLVFIAFNEYFYVTITRFKVLESGLSTQERIRLFSSAIKAIFSFPTFFTGLGIGGFSYYYSGMDIPHGTYPHNIFLEIGSELGVLGLFAFGIIMLHALFKGLQNIRICENNRFFNVAVTVLIFFIYMLLNALVSGDINDNRVLFSSIGMIYAVNYLIQKGRNGIDGRKDLSYYNSSSSF